MLLIAITGGLLWRNRSRIRSAPQPGEPVDKDDSDEELAVDLAKLLLASNLEFVRSTSQALHALNTLLLTAYIALFVALGKRYGFFTVSPFLTALPVALFGGSLFVSFLRSVAVRKSRFVLGDLRLTFLAYEHVLKERRRQIWLPAALTGLGIGSIAVVVAAAV